MCHPSIRTPATEMHLVADEPAEGPLCPQAGGLKYAQGPHAMYEKIVFF